MASEHWVFGYHAVRAALSEGADHVEVLWVQLGRRDARIAGLMGRAEAAGVVIHRAPRAALDERCGGGRHQGVVARCRTPPAVQTVDLDSLLAAAGADLFLLVLDGVQDPHNLGACLRTAEAAGVQGVILPRDRAVGITSTVRKVASGAAEVIPLLQVTNLARTLRTLRDAGVRLVGAAPEAPATVYQADLRGPLALVLGGEEKGLRRLTREGCDLLVHLPMAGRVESLNVAVAAGVLLFEAQRQRRGR
ncbi:MAG: 23S rRNA (guanosine(2251)-2'-O)-methyltransferase RlmB [Chromatiales bacterium 21-64-14]|nr:MAG: 23S rRNA (guanosine(2251)-2'-O)-methyltransferase RlmB [Chromatiales bacterium 21-64-14]HQU14731.1 23S rRNA (guanosine(2251)-2'-O)-methyltransferase RlmB [Gammaproteobacteria bacterium]